MVGPVRGRRHLGRDLSVLVVVKAALLVLLYGLFFSPAHRPAIDAGAVEAALLGARR